MVFFQVTDMCLSASYVNKVLILPKKRGQAPCLYYISKAKKNLIYKDGNLEPALITRYL